jgi:hypothetical protein
MDDVLRQRLWRHIEALPEEQVYQVLDYIEFLSSKYARQSVRPPGSSLQQFSERMQDKLRAQGVGIRAMRGTLDAMGTADRVFSGIAEAGRTLLREVEEGLKAPPADPNRPATRSLPPAQGSEPPAGEIRRDIPVD